MNVIFPRIDGRTFSFVVLLLGSTLALAQGGAAVAEGQAAAHMRTLNNSLLNLHGQMQQADASSARTLRSTASNAIAQRNAALIKLIQHDPRAALSFSFSPELLSDLAAKFPQAATLLEAHTTVTGKAEHWIADYPGFKSSQSIWRMNVGGHSLDLHFAAGEPSNLKSDHALQVTGVVVGSAMAVETSVVVQTGPVSSLADSPLPYAGNSRSAIWQWPMWLMAGFVFAGPRRKWSTRITRRQTIGFLQHLAIFIMVFALVVSGSVSTYAQNSCSTKGVQNTAVLLVNFSDIATTAVPATAYSAFFDTSTGRSLSGYWQEASYGQTSAAGNVFGPFTLGASTSYNCSTIFNQLANDVLTAAVAGGVNLQIYSRIFVILPNISCGWAGLTLMGSAGSGCSTINTSVGGLTASLSYIVDSYMNSAQYPFSDPRDTAVALLAHEGGHQLGLAHSGTITERPTSVLEPPDALGHITDRGDLWTVMGSNNLGLYQAQQKAEILGWLASSNYQTVSSSGSYALQPLETSPPTGLQALRVQRGTTPGHYLWVEYKQPIGQYDSTLANAPYTAAQPYTGAMVTYEDPVYNTGGQIAGHTYLVDFNLGDTYWLAPDLNPGQTWSDAYTNVSLSVASANSTGLTLNVDYGSTPCTATNPIVTASPLDPSIYPGSSVAYNVSVTNNDSSGCSPSTFNVDSTQPSGWPTSLSANSVTLNPGQSTTVTMYKIGPSGTAPGTYAVNANASSNSRVGSGSANVTLMAAPSLTVSTSVPASSFALRSTVPITASVLNGGSPASGASVTFTLTAPAGNTTTQSGTTGSTGAVTWNYRTNSRSGIGTYSVSAQAAVSSGGKKASSTQSTTSNTVSFSVQ